VTHIPWISIIALLSFSGPALGSDSRIKAWKTFSSNYGYVFKYPDCWDIKPDNPDELDTPVQDAHDIALEESKKCVRPLLNPPHQNIVGFSAGRVKTPQKDKLLKELNSLEKNSVSKIDRKDWLYFKHFKIGLNDAYVDVRFEKMVGYSYLFWEAVLYCPTYEVLFSGPAIKNPDQTYFDRFKAGDIALPEPEKTIFESIHCTEPKNTKGT
jgi:hypothetical protein